MSGMGFGGMEHVINLEQARQRISELERQLAEAQAEMGAMREALETIERFLSRPKNEHNHREACRSVAVRALAPEAGKKALEWKESALRALEEWHEAREIVGGAQLGDGPIEWAKRVLARLEEAEHVSQEHDRKVAEEERDQALTEVISTLEADIAQRKADPNWALLREEEDMLRYQVSLVRALKVATAEPTASAPVGPGNG